jgi:hypothetical protein
MLLPPFLGSEVVFQHLADLRTRTSVVNTHTNVHVQYYTIMPSICWVEWDQWIRHAVTESTFSTANNVPIYRRDCCQQPICGKLHKIVVVCPLLGLVSTFKWPCYSRLNMPFRIQGAIQNFPNMLHQVLTSYAAVHYIVLSQFLLIILVSNQYSALHCMMQRCLSMFVFSIFCECCGAL